MQISTRELANILACSLAEANVQTSNEGLLYAGCMSVAGLDQFNAAISALVLAGLIEKLPGHQLRVTAALKNAYEASKAKGHVPNGVQS